MGRSTLRALEIDPDVQQLERLLWANGYGTHTSLVTGIFDEHVEDAVELFQLQHIGKDGDQLISDGIVGPATWWALENPSGDAQRSHLSVTSIDLDLTPVRVKLMELLLREHSKDVRESPDGSNRSRDIDQYWGETGLIGHPWCCAFVSWGLDQVLEAAVGEGFGGAYHVGVMKMLRTASRLGRRVEAPKPLDVFVQEKKRGKGHTGFVVGVSSDDKTIYTCEGNCGNRLKLGKRKANTIDYFLDAFQDGQSPQFRRGGVRHGLGEDVSSDGDR